MQVIEVCSNQQNRLFLDMVDDIYCHDSSYIRPLDLMISEIFDREKNDLFKNGDAVRYILLDNNKIIGRIAAFINGKKAYLKEQPTGGIGFFECINDPVAASMLFDAAREWLSNKGMQAMDGPVNFGENDNFWGLLVDGFTQPGFGMQYNPPYYKQLFEQYGFRVYYEQITNHLDVKKPFPERFWSIAEHVMKKPELSFRHFNWKHYHRFAADFVEIYNEAWQFHESFVPMNPDHLRKIMKKNRLFIREELIWFAYVNDEPAGLIVMFPDINQIIRKTGSHLNLFNKFRFWVHLHDKTITRLRVTVLGVKPKFQRMGIESCLFYQYRNVLARKPHITEMELSWVGDFNPKMRKLQEAMGAEFGKKHCTYRYLFDDKGLHQRASVIPMDTKDQAHS